MAMQWHDLAFLHWPIAAKKLRPFIPTGLELQEFDGSAWLGVVPFFMRGVRIRGIPPLPGTGAFAELNLRTYVTANGKPGVWFFSLDAASRVAVRAARRTFHLPYFDARMIVKQTANEIDYASVRTELPTGEFAASYQATSPVRTAMPGSIDHWFTERYCLYSADRRGRLYCGEIHHTPWPLQLANCEIRKNSLSSQLQIELAPKPAFVHFAKRLDVVAWYLRRVA
jgi:uncharacterized protein YqjF (DUF2071 family)